MRDIQLASFELSVICEEGRICVGCCPDEPDRQIVNHIRDGDRLRDLPVSGTVSYPPSVGNVCPVLAVGYDDQRSSVRPTELRQHLLVRLDQQEARTLTVDLLVIRRQLS